MARLHFIVLKSHYFTYLSIKNIIFAS